MKILEEPSKVVAAVQVVDDIMKSKLAAEVAVIAAEFDVELHLTLRAKTGGFLLQVDIAEGATRDPIVQP